MIAPRRTLSALCLTLAALAVAAAPALFASPASAAAYGPGIDVGLGRLGAYVTPIGTQAYCLEIQKNRPVGSTDAGTVGGWGSLGEDALARMNWVLQVYGQSSDPVITSAVNLYVWSVADPGAYDAHGMSGDDYYGARAGDARGQVLAALAAIRQQVAALPPRGSVAIELAPDLSGRVTVEGGGATVTLAGTDVAEPVRLEDGDDLSFTADPAEGARTAEVSATADFDGVAYPALITVHDSGSAQHLAGPAGSPVVAAARASVPLDLRPVLVSAVAEPVLAAGTPAVDQLTVDVADDSPAPWRAGTSVRFRGALYGPLAAAPVVADQVPEDAPIAWEETVEVDAPGVVQTSGGFSPTRPGFYTWVWSVDAADQPDASLVAAGYAWADRFGLPAETFQVVMPLPRTGASGLDGPGWLSAAGAVFVGGGLTVAATTVRRRADRRDGARERS